MKTAYETMYLLPAAIAEDQVDQLNERLKKSVEKKNGEILRIEKIGVRKTAYPINKQGSAFYVLFQFAGSGETIHEMERTLKNTDEVLKFLSTKITSRTPRGFNPSTPEPVAVEATLSPEPPQAGGPEAESPEPAAEEASAEGKE